jgi:hypothetical protein
VIKFGCWPNFAQYFSRFLLAFSMVSEEFRKKYAKFARIILEFASWDDLERGMRTLLPHMKHDGDAALPILLWHNGIEGMSWVSKQNLLVSGSVLSRRMSLI